MAVDAVFDGAVFDDVVDVEGEGLFDEAGDLYGPGASLEGVRVFGGLILLDAELVEVVVVGGFVEGSLIFGGGVFAGDGVELVGGEDGGFRIEDGGDFGGDGSCA